MHQLHRARTASYSGKCEKKLKASQALRYKLSAYSNAHKHIIFPVVNMLSVPGLLMQRMTTKEPDDEMIEVGIASVEAVFDWKKWQEENNVCSH